MEEKDCCKIKHVRNGRELRLPELPDFSVDGYCTETKTVYEFLGCFYHGCYCQPFRDLETKNEDTLAERYDSTTSRIAQITRAGYQVKMLWECEFDASKIVEQKPELITHPIVILKLEMHCMEGRTEALRLHHKIEENEQFNIVRLWACILTSASITSFQ